MIRLNFLYSKIFAYMTCIYLFLPAILTFRLVGRVSYDLNEQTIAFLGGLISLLLLVLIDSDYVSVLHNGKEIDMFTEKIAHLLVCAIWTFGTLIALCVICIQFASAQVMTVEVAQLNVSRGRGATFSWQINSHNLKLNQGRFRLTRDEFYQLKQNPRVKIQFRQNFAGQSVEILSIS